MNTLAVPTRTWAIDPHTKQIRSLIADALDIDVVEVVPELALQDIPEWSSIDHVSLMLALEKQFNLTIDGPLVVKLNSVRAIESFITGISPCAVAPDDADPTDASSARPCIHRGLDGVHVDESAISSIDGQRSELLIRGYSIEQLAAHASFEEMFHLVLWGDLPAPTALTRLHDQLREAAVLSDELVSLVERMSDCHPMVALRTVLSFGGRAGPAARPRSADEVRDEALIVAARVPSILAIHHAARQSMPRPQSAEGASLAARFLHQFFNRSPCELHVEALDLAMRVQAEHGANASTFAARVTASAGSDLIAALVSAMSTFAGPLHGGAVEAVIDALRKIGGASNATSYVAARRARHEPVMGFGHRVYRSADPRVAPVRAMAEALCRQAGDSSSLDTMAAIELAMAPYQRHGLHMNVDAYTAVLYHALGIPDDYFSSLFTMSRIVGWAAHVAEQVERNVLIRPLLAYTGEPRRQWSER